MDQKDIQQALESLGKMAELEIAVSKFYAACGQQWGKEAPFWFDLASMEVQHARNMQMIAEIVKKGPSKFTLVRFINFAALNTVITRVKNYTNQIISTKLSQKDAILIARDTEDSVLEILHTKLFESDDFQYAKLMKRIESETIKHKTFFENSIKEIKPRKV